MANVTVGSPLEQLHLRRVLMKHQLPGGETVLEGCNLERTAVLTVSDDIWAKGFVAYVSLRIPDDQVSCRGIGSSAAPVADFAATTNQAVRLGDSTERIRQVYGNPIAKRVIGDREMWTYDHGIVMTRPVSLVITLRGGRATKITLGMKPKR